MKMNYPKSMVAGDGLSVVLRPLGRDDAQALRSFLPWHSQGRSGSSKKI